MAHMLETGKKGLYHQEVKDKTIYMFQYSPKSLHTVWNRVFPEESVVGDMRLQLVILTGIPLGTEQ